MTDKQVFDIENLDWMIGTEGGKDYYVVGRAGGLALGIKIFHDIDADVGAAMFGIRVRASLDPNPAMDIAPKAISDVGEVAGGLFHIKFPQNDKTRSSLHSHFVCQAGSRKEFIDNIESAGFEKKFRGLLNDILQPAADTLIYETQPIIEHTVAVMKKHFGMALNELYPDESTDGIQVNKQAEMPKSPDEVDLSKILDPKLLGFKSTGGDKPH